MTAKGKAPKDDKWKAKYKEPKTPDTTNLPELPEGWCWASIQQLAKPEKSSICAGPFGTIFKARDFRDSGVPIIFLRHVKPDKYLTKKSTFMDKKKWDELFQPYSVYGGELLVTKLGEPPGEAAVFPQGVGHAMLTPDVMKMEVNQEVAITRYVMHYLNSDVARRIAFGLAFGTTRLRLTLPIFRDLAVPLPPLPEQRRIVDEIDAQLSRVDDTNAVVEKSERRCSRMRQSILKWAFEGKLVDQDPQDEPASVLLERIKTEREAAEPPKKNRSGGRKKKTKRKNA